MRLKVVPLDVESTRRWSREMHVKAFHIPKYHVIKYVGRDRVKTSVLDDSIAERDHPFPYQGGNLAFSNCNNVFQRYDSTYE